MTLSISIKTKSQIWSLDVIIAIIIFLGALMFFYTQGLISLDAVENDISGLLLDGKIISSYLVSTGYPENWIEEDVTLIGLTNGSLELDTRKVEVFSTIADDDYQLSRKLLSTSHDYFLFFQDKNNQTLQIVPGVDWIGKDYAEADPADLIRVVRLVNYDSDIIKMVLYVWEGKAPTSTTTPPPASLPLDFSIATSCTGSTLFEVTALTNAHSGLVGSGYTYKACVSLDGGTLDIDTSDNGGVIIASLSDTINANIDINGGYDNDIYLKSTPGSISCVIRSSCNSDENCAYSASADTNAHIGDCDAYIMRKMCCKWNP